MIKRKCKKLSNLKQKIEEKKYSTQIKRLVNELKTKRGTTILA